MQLKIFKPLWGHDGTVEDAIHQAVAAEFDGIEGQVPEDKDERSRLKDQLAAADLEMIAEIYTGGWYVPSPHATPADHLKDLRKGLERSLPMHPLFVNTQTGLDAWPLKVQVDYFRQLIELEAEFQTTITVETHRSRSTYNPWVTAELIRELPDLKLNLDFSHWCCVAERLVMNNDPDLLKSFGQNCWHLHARVGYDQGPQVPDPRAPEYFEAVSAHLDWWKQMWACLALRGFQTITMTPEFGTDGYLHLQPYTQEPVADLWDVNQWMGRELRQVFSGWCEDSTPHHHSTPSSEG
ncbi:MAG: sugar phosphate isomerase/epimerase [Verrucomicrobiota bacterium]